jgi:hypothetical protein
MQRTGDGSGPHTAVLPGGIGGDASVVASAFLGTAQVPPMVHCVNVRISVTFIGGNFGD